MYTLGKPHLFYYNVDKQEFNIDTSRNGQSTKRKWSSLNNFISDRIYLIDISFGICTHPFNPEGVSFRKPFSKLKENEYGIAFKGTPIKLKDWENLVPDSNPVSMSTRKMMNRRGAEVSYPYTVQELKDKGWYELAKQSIYDNGISALLSSRTLPKITTPEETIYFVPMPIYAMELSPHSHHLKILFNEKQTVKSWSRHHAMYDLNWEDKILPQPQYESSGRA
jgi:hypothetical protein|tara:strand:+ start:207 stop:875 length:669 start_codon:yes stop_codon:yes gene_type:complete